MWGAEPCQGRPPGCHRPRVFPPRPCTSSRCLAQGKPQHPWKSQGSSGCCRGWEGKSKRGGSPRGWNICVAAFRPGVTRVSARNKTSPERGAAVSPQLMNGPKNRFPVYPATNRFWGRGHLLAIFCQAPAQLAPRPAGLWPAPSCPLRCCSIHVRQGKGPAEAAEGWRSRAESRSQPCHQHHAVPKHGCRVKPSVPLVLGGQAGQGEAPRIISKEHFQRCTAAWTRIPCPAGVQQSLGRPEHLQNRLGNPAHRAPCDSPLCFPIRKIFYTQNLQQKPSRTTGKLWGKQGPVLRSAKPILNGFHFYN